MKTHKFKLERSFAPEYDILNIEEMELEMTQQQYDSLSRIGTLVDQERWYKVSVIAPDIIEHEDFRADTVLFNIYGASPLNWVYYFQSKWDSSYQYEYIMREIYD
jgi:hypothetical protein